MNEDRIDWSWAFISLMGVIAFLVILWPKPSDTQAGVPQKKYEQYQRTTLKNLLESYAENLDEGYKEHLLELPRKLQYNTKVVKGKTTIIPDGEWVYLDEYEQVCIHFIGCTGTLIFDER